MITLEIDSVTPVVQGREGEIHVTATNEGRMRVHRLDIAVAASSPGLSITPSVEHGGYVITTGLEPGEKICRPFLVRAVTADAGRSIRLTANAKFVDEKTGIAGEDAVPRSTDIKIEARPEVYAALGAADAIRDGLKELYEKAKERGRENEGKYKSHLAGGTPSEPLQVALGEEAFRWALSMVELGTRLYRVQADEAASAERKKRE